MKKIIETGFVSHAIYNDFYNDLNKIINEMQDNKLEVEIQYQSISKVSDKDEILFTALIIGRLEAQV